MVCAYIVEVTTCIIDNTQNCDSSIQTSLQQVLVFSEVLFQQCANYVASNGTGGNQGGGGGGSDGGSSTCYECKNEENEADCTSQDQCNLQKPYCYWEKDEKNNGKIDYSKGCATPSQCDNKGTPGQRTFKCCATDLCNEQEPGDDEAPPPDVGNGGGSKEVVTNEPCDPELVTCEVKKYTSCLLGFETELYLQLITGKFNHAILCQKQTALTMCLTGYDIKCGDGFKAKVESALTFYSSFITISCESVCEIDTAVSCVTDVLIKAKALAVFGGSSLKWKAVCGELKLVTECIATTTAQCNFLDNAVMLAFESLTVL
jgi:hypothetical protein